MVLSQHGLILSCLSIPRIFLLVETTVKEDVQTVKTLQSCRFLKYEVERSSHLLVNLADILTALNDILINVAPPQDRTLGNEVADKIGTLKEQLEQLLLNLKDGNVGDEIWPQYKEFVSVIDSIHRLIDSFHLPSLCDDILDLTDAGPGVGVSNVQVRYRDAEIARLHKSKRRNRIHRARHNSSQNEAEHTNAAIGTV